MSDIKSHEAVAHDAAALPVMLPTKLIGRESALAQVYAQLKANRPALVYGAAGVGKTALAATLASAYAQQSGGVLWFNVDDESLESLIVRVGRAYNIADIATADNPTAMVGAVAATLSQHKPLLVLDGKIDSQVASKFISRCADRLPVILVSRENLEGAWESIGLSPLEPAQAALMFKQESGLTTPEHDAAVLQLVDLLDHLPFSIGVAARAMLASKQQPVAYAALLTQVKATTGGDSAEAALTTSFGALNGALQGVILIMGATFRGEASAELLSLISGAPAESVQQAMNMLVQLRLVERITRYDVPYYRLHALTARFAKSRLESSNRLDDLQAKVRDATLAYVERYSGDHDRLSLELENFLVAARWGERNNHRDIGAKLSALLSAAGNFTQARGYSYELTRLRSSGATTPFPAYPPEAISSDTLSPEDQLSALLSSDDDDENYDDYDGSDLDDDGDDDSEELIPNPFLHSIRDEDDDDEDDSDDDSDDYAPLPLDDLTLLPLDDDDEDDSDDDRDDFDHSDLFPPAMPSAPQIAIPYGDLDGLRAALTQARQLGDKSKQVEILRAIGKLQIAQSMNTEALTTYTEALGIYEGQENREGILESLDMLSALLVKTDNAQAAILNATRGITLASEINDNITRLQLLMTLGDARQQLGESEEAAKVYSQALELTRNTDDSQHEAIVLYKLGFAQLDTGDAETAIETWEQALKLFKAQAKHDYEGRVLGGLGSAYGELGRWAEAINFHMSALYIARDVKDAEEEALQLTSLGYANVQAGQLGDALTRYRQALHLAYQAQNRDNIVTTIVDLVRLLLRSPQHLSISELLIQSALEYEPNDRDVKSLHERITNEKLLAQANGTAFKPVNGTAQTYAQNAYHLLEV